ncbi:CbiQ family ECF transporter T component [Roseobacteraceae bacterium NS-SX3]
MISLTSPVETWAHPLPAGLKLAALSLATAGLFALQDPLVLAATLAGVLALYASGGRRFLASGLASLRVLWPFLAVIALWHGIEGSWAAGAAVALRLLAAVALANFVTMTTRLSDMTDVAALLLRPFRWLGLSTRALELSIALTVRFTPLLGQKGTLLAEAWRARSPRRPSWRIALPLTVQALDDADHVAEALKARGGLH